MQDLATDPVRIGLISDTHGLLRPEVFDLLAGVDLILHAGDIGPVEILIELEAIAPTIAVRGNTDGFETRERAPAEAHLEYAGQRIVVVHGDRFGSPTPATLREVYPDANIIVYGHTHRPLIDRTDGRLVVNPGAAGRRRFDILPTVGILTVGPEGADAEILEIT